MTNAFYNATSNPAARSRGRSSPIRDEFAAIEEGFDLVAPINSPVFTGTPTAPTPASPADNSTKLATTEFVQHVLGSAGALLPVQTTHAGKVLATDGSVASWESAFPAQTGNAGKFLQTDGTDETWQVVVDVQEFAASGTWTKPDGVTFVLVEMLGAGAGGSAAQRRTAISNAGYGGGGGGGGCYVARLFTAAELSATETVTIGAGGSGGSGDGASGAAGGDTTFGAKGFAGGGAVNGTWYYGGPGGGSVASGHPHSFSNRNNSATPNNLGTGGAAAQTSGLAGCAEYGGAAGGGITLTNVAFHVGGSSVFGGAGGGAGGSYSSSNTSWAAGAGGVCGSYTGGGGGAIGTSGASPTAGTAGTSVVTGRIAGTGGGGGGGSNTLTVLGAAGGAGGRGCGGGGGGVSTAASGNGGAGGAGGDGYCRVTSW